MTFKPEFDNLYLDMNGIVHGATHGDELDPSKGFDMDASMARMFRYIDNLIRLAKPRKLVYMALDGVAPRAKMNQQRQRRFRSAQEAQEMHEQMVKTGEWDPTSTVFDSNAITPGTDFMAALTPHLQYFIRKKINEDPLWKNLTVIFSGHEVPGEGEHKIMEYIRAMKMQEGYDPNTSHCVYGLDADLIFLSLVLHEPHTALLREEVVFGGLRQQKGGREQFAKSSNFQLLHISLLREYFSVEFSFTFDVDIERCIDDFVLLCFMIGNDFIPHIPSMDIGESGLDTLIVFYKQYFARSQAHLTDGKGNIDFAMLAPLFSELGKLEDDVFAQRKRKERGGRHGARVFIEIDSELENESDDEEIDGLIEGMQLGVPEAHSYYAMKWRRFVSENDVREICNDYLKGMYWVLQYYYQGVLSWGWFYPHFYAPLASDLGRYAVELSLEIPNSFDKGTPFDPVQQLMAVLPPASAALVPKPLSDLMVSPVSPVLDLYPQEFEIDMNGKRNAWEAIVLIPFVDEKRLLAAMSKYSDVLEKLESSKKGADWQFYHCTDSSLVYSYPSTLPNLFPSITNCHVQCQVFQSPSYSEYRSFICEGVVNPFRTFPFMRAVELSGGIDSYAKVNVFGHPSKKESLVLSIGDELYERMVAIHSEAVDPSLLAFKSIIETFLGKLVYVDWPFFRQAMVCELSCAFFSAAVVNHQYQLRAFSERESNEWVKQRNECVSKWKSDRGVDLSKVTVLFHVKRLKGLEISGKSIRREFDEEIQVAPSQLCLEYERIPFDDRFMDRSEAQDISTAFPIGSLVIVTQNAKQLAGRVGTVISHTSQQIARVSLQAQSRVPPDCVKTLLKQIPTDSYLSILQIARELKERVVVVSKLLSNVQVDPGYINIGLSLKYKKRCEMTGGLVRYNEKDEDFEYSRTILVILKEYKQKFPKVFEIVGQQANVKKIDGKFLITGDQSVSETLTEIQKYLRALPSSSLPLVPQTSSVLTASQVEQVDASVRQILRKTVNAEVFDINCLSLYREGQDVQWSPSSSQKFALGDRVAFLGGPLGIPFGTQGTVIGLHPQSEVFESFAVDVMFDCSVICGTSLHSRCPPTQGATMETHCLLNLSTVKKGKPGFYQKIENVQEKVVNAVKERKADNGERKLPEDEYNAYAHLWNDLQENPPKVLPAVAIESGAGIRRGRKQRRGRGRGH